ncbi:DNA repair photolyase [Nocardiopsis flavescens]|uniref:DNA repair photolyase n=1 Tax=Nocardiopsis flavescens TaxID=758803 RepID=A0A1M6JFH8_9ACTN|nr:Rv2578c family radical SAM protein [Nocardiopsis flavescens]SHJ45459.1 DNA repair photolyase [Nocardiopsis flavescens]
MRWENLRESTTSVEQTALFDHTPAPPPRGTGRAGLRTAGPGPVRAGGDGEPVAIEVRARSIINRVPGESPLFRWSLNPYRGCSHACVYCFARRTHEYLDLDSGHDFDTRIVVKVNAGSLLRAELARPSWRGEHIAMGTNTDPYQRAEGRYRLMPQIIAALRDAANPFSILTKGTLVLRDLDLLEQAARVTDVGMAVSVGSVDEAVWRTVEPGTPGPRARLDAVRRLTERGLECSVLMAPILPGLTDSAERIEETVAAIAAAGAVRVTPVVLHLRPGAREWYRAWLTREHPRLLPLYRRLYGQGSYAPESYRGIVTEAVREIAGRHGLNRPGSARRAPDAAPDAAAGRRPEQLALGFPG